MRIARNVLSWAFYDFANSAYLLIYTTFLLPVFFSTVLVSRGYSLHAWGMASGISTVCGVILAMTVGRHADKTNRFTTFAFSILISFTGMMVVAAAAQYAVSLLFAAYIVTNAFFILTLSLSDSILPYVSSNETASSNSGFAWGFGYLGGIAALLFVVPLQRITGDYSFVVFASVAIFYLLFSLYSLWGLRSVHLNDPPTMHVTTRRMHTPSKFLLLFGYWLISECITVILLFYAIFLSTELHLGNLMIALLLLLVQLIAFPATWIGGILARGRSLRVLGITVLCWGIAIALLILRGGWLSLSVITVLGGLAVGNSQSILRAQYATIIDRRASGVEFGLYSVISEGAVFIGPIIYGYASDFLGSQKIPLVALFVLMVIGYGIVVNVTRGLKKL